jgi:transposase
LHGLLSSRGVINEVVEPTSILVTGGAQRAKTNRLDAVGLLRVLALKVHGRSRRLPIIVAPSVEEEDALRPPGRSEEAVVPFLTGQDHPLPTHNILRACGYP